MMIILFVILIVAFGNSLLIEKIYRSMPITELRRMARRDKHYINLYRLMAYGPSLRLLLWLKGTLSASLIIIWAARTSWWLALLAGLAVSACTIAALTGQNARGWQLRYVSTVAPVGAKVLGWLQPLVGRLAHLVARHTGEAHTKIYEKEDLIDLLKQQARQPDNRLSEAQLKATRGALSFGDKSVGQVMTPRVKAKLVLASETVGPMIMDELHKTGQKRFAVVKEISKAAHPEVVGSLYTQDLLDHLQDGGHIRDLMHAGVNTINETQKLSGALAEFLKTGNYLLVVTNNFEETVGVITLEDVLGQIFGHVPSAEVPAQNEHGHSPDSKVE